jgi:hypothetical protein
MMRKIGETAPEIKAKSRPAHRYFLMAGSTISHARSEIADAGLDGRVVGERGDGGTSNEQNQAPAITVFAEPPFLWSDADGSLPDPRGHT